MSNALAGSAFSGRFFRILAPFEPGASFVAKASDLRRRSDAAWATSSEEERETPCTITPPWGDPSVETQTPLAWKDQGTGVLRFALRLETRSVPKTAVMDRAEALSQARSRRPISDLAPGQKKTLMDEAKRELLKAFPTKVRMVEGYALHTGSMFLGLPTSISRPSTLQLLRDLFGPIVPWPGVAFVGGGGWDASALSVLARGASAEGGRLTEDVQVRSVRLQDAHVRINTRDSGVPVSALLRDLIAQRPLPTVHQIGFSVLHQGVLREVDVDFEGVARVFPPPSGFGLWSDRLLRRHADAMDILARVRRAMEVSRDAVGRTTR